MGARRARGGTRRRVLRSRHHAGSDAGDEVLETGRGACNAKLSPPCSQRSELPGLSSVLHARYYSLTRSPRRVCVCVCVCVSVCGDAEGCGVEVGSPRSERVRLNSTGAILVQVRRDPGVAVGSPLSGRVRRNSTVPIVVQVRRDPGVEVGNPLSGRVRVNSYRPHASPSPPETPSTAAE